MRGPSTKSVTEFAKALQCCNATAWAIIGRDEVATIKLHGLTRVVDTWGDNAPPRPGRRPSIEELVWELALGEKQPKRRMPEGVHKGRPRLQPSAELLGE
jgi:hypothetical protein